MLTSFVWSLVSVETILSSGFYFPERWRKVPSFVNIKLPLPPSTHKMSFEGSRWWLFWWKTMGLLASYQFFSPHRSGSKTMASYQFRSGSAVRVWLWSFWPPVTRTTGAYFTILIFFNMMSTLRLFFLLFCRRSSDFSERLRPVWPGVI